MHEYLGNVQEAIAYAAYIEERLWGGRHVLWQIQQSELADLGTRKFLHRVDLELKEKDQLMGWINFAWLVNIDLTVDEPRARYEFMIAFKSVGGDTPIFDHLRLYPRYYTLDRKTSVCDIAMLEYVEQWKKGLRDFALEADWRKMPDELGENQQRVSGSCSPADDYRFATFLGQMLFDEIAKVPRSSGV